jgi:hypothetical protein
MNKSRSSDDSNIGLVPLARLATRPVRLRWLRGIFLTGITYADNMANSNNGQSRNGVLVRIELTSENWVSSDVMMRNVLGHISSKWDEMPKNIRAVAYKGGLIRRTGFNGVQLRAPIVLAIYNQVESRVRQVKALLNTYFDIEGVPEYLVQTAKGLWDEILESAYNNSLKVLHVGFGRKVSGSEIAVQAVALHRGRYEATIEVRTNESVQLGDELWFLLWTCEDAMGDSVSKLRTLPIKPVITNSQNLETERPL